MAEVVSYQGHSDQLYGCVSYSYCGQDLMVLNLFGLIGITRPTYLDIGAHHPFTISNTALMYHRGSRGVNVEANPNLMAPFALHRPEDITVNVGVGSRPGQMRLYMFDAHSGRNTFVKDMAEPFTHEGQRYDPKLGPVINIITLQDVVERYCHGVFPDFLSIDIEGMDESVLCSTNLLSGPKIICVESPLSRDAMELKEYLMRQGYICYCRMGVDLIFVSERWIERFY